MALLTSPTIIRTLSLFHLALAYLFLTTPHTIADQNLVFILGEAMGLVRSPLNPPFTPPHLKLNPANPHPRHLQTATRPLLPHPHRLHRPPIRHPRALRRVGPNRRLAARGGVGALLGRAGAGAVAFFFRAVGVYVFVQAGGGVGGGDGGGDGGGERGCGWVGGWVAE